MRRVASVMMLVMLAGCLKPVPLEQDNDASGPFVRGQAKVVSVDKTLAQAVLEYRGKRVYGYWQKERRLAQKGSVRVADPLKPPVGEYQVPVVREQEFAAEPGDTINFVGMWTGGDILLRSVEVVK